MTQGTLADASASADTLRVGLGGRVMVASNLGLTSRPTACSTWASEGLARSLEAWSGTGALVVAGNLFDTRGCDDPARAVSEALSSHRMLSASMRKFAANPGCRVVCVPGVDDAVIGSDPAAATVLGELGIEVVGAVDVEMGTGEGVRTVRIEACRSEGTTGASVPVGPPGDVAGGAESARDVELPRAPVAVDYDAKWQEGIDRLVDPGSAQRFLTSRVLYRRFARFVWWLVIPFAIAALLRLASVTHALDHLFLGHPGPARALDQAHQASWGARLAFAGVVCAAELVLLAVLVGWLGRRAWRALGGGHLDGPLDELRGPVVDKSSPASAPRSGTTVNDAVRDRARALVGRGYAGVVTGATRQAELTDLGEGFFACSGATGEVVEEQPARLGMLPVFAHHRQLSWVELEPGAELHARLLFARFDEQPPTLFERIATMGGTSRDTHPVVVAACPHGESWPPPPDLRSLRNRSRRVRRWAAAAIFLAGAVDLLSAVTPPVRSHLRLVLQVLPLGASQTAGALVALAGVALLALARGVRRGQRRAWAIASILLAASLVLHLVRGVDLAGSVVAACVLAMLLVNRREFSASTDLPSSRSAIAWLVAGVACIALATTLATQLAMHFDRDRPHLALWRLGEAVSERLVGIQTVTLPDRVNDFLAPSLLAVGFAAAVVALVLATRPLVDRSRSAGLAAGVSARDIVRRHGSGTLDYFALRTDKQWFFHRDSLVAYAIYGGVCLVSPDPIGPSSEREQVLAAFRRFADSRGWVVAVVGADQDWLPLYRDVGMHDIYIGDEAVVDVQHFSLAGGGMKGLRQAHNRIAKYGYRASFHDPAKIDPETAEQLGCLMSQSRRGEFERGFSMVLGRIFDARDEGLLLCVVTAPDGKPAAMCQFVPARGIGGFSLDLMRRDRAEHPNGLVDFALVSTIEHLKEEGYKGLSLNFAGLRALLEGERGDGVAQRVERWAVKKMSGYLQIETLWRFNAKYGPAWLPRYVVYDTAEHIVPVVLALLRAESLSEVPVIGRVIAASGRRSTAASGSRSISTAAGSSREEDAARDPEPTPAGSKPPPTGREDQARAAS
jgi:lysylphosphatidylglycerol synthetase-like protein (DUF2156 family)